MTATDDHDHHGPVDADGYCELHGFRLIGMIGSDVGCFAIVEVGSGHQLTDWFTHLTGNDIPDPAEIVDAIASGRPPESITPESTPVTPALAEWGDKRRAADEALRRFHESSSHRINFPGWKGLPEDGVVINTGQGTYPVYARYCDEWGTGHMSICELRIDLHHWTHNDNPEAVFDELALFDTLGNGAE